MPYNFDELIGRRNTASSKWTKYANDVLPMWVADMDFRSPEPVIKALTERVSHGIFGYEGATPALYDVICERMQRLYNWKVTPEEILFLPGLVSGFNLMARATGQPGDGVVMLTPVYHPFLSAPGNQGEIAQTAQLIRKTQGQIITYEIDFDAFEAAITPRTRMFLHCHPHNPIGREWTPAENRRLAEICIKHNLIICSDEIHCDLMMENNRHVPTAALSPEIADRTITLMAPSKTYNLPGLGCSFAIIQNKQLRAEVQKAEMGTIPHVNALGLTAAYAAYTEGDEWLTELRKYLTGNRDTMVDYIQENLPIINTTVPEATYLAWLDCNHAGIKGNPFEFCLVNAKVALNDGAAFGPGGEGFVRFNYGCPRSQMLEALDKMKDAFQQLQTA